jgi:hypothetical protein
MKINVYHHFDDPTLCQILKEMHTMAVNLDRLTTEVSENTTVIESAITLIDGLRQAIIDAGADPVKLGELADKLDSQSNRLAAAVADNTPAA